MADPIPLAQVMARLETAIDSLAGAVDRRLQSDQSQKSLQDQIQRLGEDRSLLASELDTQKMHRNTLEDANREVSRRLVAAMESIRTVLDQHSR